jgi:hypothetical protein
MLILANSLLTIQVLWEKIPEAVKGFVWGVILMSLVLGILYGAGVDDPKVVYVP